MAQTIAMNRNQAIQSSANASRYIEIMNVSWSEMRLRVDVYGQEREGS